MHGSSVVSDRANTVGAINFHRLYSTKNKASADAAGTTPRQFQGACVQTALFAADDYTHPDQSRLDLHNQHLVCLHPSNISAAVCHVTLWC